MSVKEGEDLRLIYFARLCDRTYIGRARFDTQNAADAIRRAAAQTETIQHHGDGASIASSERLRNTAEFIVLFSGIYIHFFIRSCSINRDSPPQKQKSSLCRPAQPINYTVRNVYKYIYTHNIIICETSFIHRGNETEGVRRESGSIINFDNEFKEKSRGKKKL